MTKTLLLFSVLLLVSCATSDLTIKVPAQQTVEIDLSKYNFYKASIKNKGTKSISVGVLSKKSGTQIRGFGIGPKGKADVMVEKENLLALLNQTDSDLSISINIEKKEAMPAKAKDQYVSLTLRNKSMKSIPLLIPSVMNPNLSPNSKSGVELKVGQEIYFKNGGKKYILLTVGKSYYDGQEIDVVEVLKQRKKELGIK